MLILPATPRECAEARRFAERTLVAWDSGRLRDDARAVVGELTANAVLHGRPHHPADSADPADAADLEIRLKLTLRPGHLLVAVTDRGAALPVRPGSAGPLDTAGRGLHVVEALSDHWGWTRYRPTGKTVWAMLPTRTRT